MIRTSPVLDFYVLECCLVHTCGSSSDLPFGPVFCLYPCWWGFSLKMQSSILPHWMCVCVCVKSLSVREITFCAAYGSSFVSPWGWFLLLCLAHFIEHEEYQDTEWSSLISVFLNELIKFPLIKELGGVSGIFLMRSLHDLRNSPLHLQKTAVTKYQSSTFTCWREWIPLVFGIFMIRHELSYYLKNSRVEINRRWKQKSKWQI
jgi:hypothetical protein